MIPVSFFFLVRMGLRDLDRQFNKSEDDIKALQSVGQIIGSVLKQLDEDRCKCLSHHGFDHYPGTDIYT